MEIKSSIHFKLSKKIFFIIISIFLFESFVWGDEAEKRIPILCYHRFAAQVNDPMTIKTSVFDEQLKWLKNNGYTVISLEDAIQYLRGKIKIIPTKSVVITVDDGHKSVYSEMAPLVKKYGIPVTLFIYPSAISNAPYAMTWKQLRELEETTLFCIESHTYWHPNFQREKKKLSSDEYEKFVDFQLRGSKQKLEEKMGHEVNYLAWAFGIYDKELENKAVRSGYAAALSIDGRHAGLSDPIMALPRYMIVSKYDIKAFGNIVNGMKHSP